MYQVVLFKFGHHLCTGAIAHGFLSFCKWSFTSISQDGRYFISLFRMSGSALESIFSVLKPPAHR